MSTSPQRKITYGIVAASILVPILVMIWNYKVGGVLLVMGVMVAIRTLRFRWHDDDRLLNAAEEARLDRHASERGRTILVQIVDDFGYDLPPETVKRLIANAQAQASPRDMVVPVRHKVPSEANRPRMDRT